MAQACRGLRKTQFIVSGAGSDGRPLGTTSTSSIFKQAMSPVLVDRVIGDTFVLPLTIRKACAALHEQTFTKPGRHERLILLYEPMPSMSGGCRALAVAETKERCVMYHISRIMRVSFQDERLLRSRSFLSGIMVTLKARSLEHHVAAARPPASAVARPETKSYSSVFALFAPNDGQLDPAVKYLARGLGSSIFLRTDEAFFRFHPSEETRRPNKKQIAPEPAPTILRLRYDKANTKRRSRRSLFTGKVKFHRQ